MYAVGDVQGCCDALEQLLQRIDFSPSRDRLFVLGDLVNRGPHSGDTLRRLQALGASAQCVLGNHDIHALAVAYGVRPAHRSDTLHDIVQAPDSAALIDWLRHQRLAVFEAGWLMVHAGAAPHWTLDDTLDLAAQLEHGLQAPEDSQVTAFLRSLFGNEPSRWNADDPRPDRLRFAVNALTRMRFVRADGGLDLITKGGVAQPPPGSVPWFEAPERKTQGVPIAFGHWSTLGLVNRPDLLALDTGCVWGGQLSAARIDAGRREIIQVPCSGAKGSSPAAGRTLQAAKAQ